MPQRYVDPATIAPGPQQPQKYPFVGANYRKFGEVTGWIYDYVSDSYYIDPAAHKQTYPSIYPPAPPEPPGLAEQLLPLAVGGLALAGGTALGKDVPGFLGLGGTSTGAGVTAPTAPTTPGLLGKVGGYLGLGESPAAAATQVLTEKALPM